MLRITQAQTDTGQHWTLCGQLTGPWVAELRACWERGRQAEGGARTIVDLSDVTFIDESGEKLLSEMRAGGAEFVAGGVDTKHLLEHLKAKGERSLRRCIGPLTNWCGKSANARNEGGK
jgi:hypothetical protein